MERRDSATIDNCRDLFYNISHYPLSLFILRCIRRKQQGIAGGATKGNNTGVESINLVAGERCRHGSLLMIYTTKKNCVDIFHLPRKTMKGIKRGPRKFTSFDTHLIRAGRISAWFLFGSESWLMVSFNGCKSTLISLRLSVSLYRVFLSRDVSVAVVSIICMIHEESTLHRFNVST